MGQEGCLGWKPAAKGSNGGYPNEGTSAAGVTVCRWLSNSYAAEG